MADGTPTDHSYIGQTYDGEEDRYTIESEIGRGGMGSVYMAGSEKSGRKFAVKFLHAQLQEESVSARERFIREIKVLQDLRAFPGIVRIEDVGQTDGGTYFLVMEYINAPTLDKVVEQNPNGLDQIVAVQIIIQVLTVLEPVHRQGFVHRDLKPSNICYFEDTLSCRVLDFGLSKPEQEGARYQKVTVRRDGRPIEITGSPHYMAPEQVLRPRDVDQRTDLYALGITLYELLSGSPPFRGIYHQDILKQQQEKKAAPIESCVDGTPLSYRLQTVLDKALAKNQEDRHKNAEEFKESLYDVLNMLNKINQRRKPLGDRFRISKKIGQGGNAEVFEAHDIEENAAVVLKVVREGSSDWDTETLMNEADRALEHECIVQVMEFGSYEGRDAIVMELMDQGTLEELIEEYGDAGFPEKVLFVTIRDICRGLHHAHRRGIVHRDVKPSNMLRNSDGRTKLCDFGIAKPFEKTGEEMQGRKTMQFKGTTLYSSPEQCDLEGRVDPRSDIYSLGVVMYELLSGKPPFFEGVVTIQHIQSDPPPLQVRGKYRNPDELCRIVEKCLQKSLDLRFQSMKEVAQELDRVYRLDPQPKAHKPYEMDTLDPETTASGDGATREIARLDGASADSSGTKTTRLVAGIAGAVLVISILIVSFWGRGPDDPVVSPNGEPVPNLVVDDPVMLEFTRLRGQVNSQAWGEVAVFPFEHLPQDDERVSVLASSMFNQVRSEIASLSEETLGETLPLLQELHGAAKHLRPNDERTAALAGFLKAGVDWDSRPPLSEAVFVPWRHERMETLVSAGRELAGSLKLAGSAERKWDALSASDRDRILDHNVQVVAKSLGELGFEGVMGDPLDGWIRELTLRQEGTSESVSRKYKPVWDALAGWIEGAARNALADPEGSAALDSLFTLLRGAVFGLFETAPEQLGDTLVQARLRSLNQTVPRPDFPISGAVVAGISPIVAAGGPFESAVHRRLGEDPTQWRTRIDQLLPVVDASFISPYAASGARKALEGEWVRSRLDELVGTSTKPLPNSAAVLGEWDAAIRSFVETLTPLDRQPVVVRWEARRLERAPVTTKTDELVASLEGLTAANNLSEIAGGLYGARSMLSDDRVVVAARDLLGRLRTANRMVSIALLANGYPALAQKAGLPQVGVLKEELLTGIKASMVLDLFKGHKTRKANQEWLKIEAPCMELILKMPESAELMKGVALTLRDGSGTASPMEQGYVLALSPSRYASVRNNRVELGCRLEFRADALDLGSLPMDLDVSTDQVCDDRSPGVEVVSGSALGELVLEVEDKNVPVDGYVPVMLFNGETRDLEARGEGRFGSIFELNDFLKVGEGRNDEASFSVRDGFDNETILVLGSELKSIRRRLVDRLEEDIRGNRRKVESSGDLGPGGFTALGEITDIAEKHFALYQGYVAPPSQEGERLVASLRERILTWLRGVTDGEKELAPVAEPFLKFTARLTGFQESWCSKGFDVVKDLNSAFEAAGRMGVNTPPTPVTPDPKPLAQKKWWQTATLPRTVTAFGLTFHLVRPQGSASETPAWICEVEMSCAFAESRVDSIRDLVRRDVRRSFKYTEDGWRKVRGEVPLVPLGRTTANRILAALNKTGELQGVAGAAGGSVRFDVPTVAQWQAAAALQVGEDLNRYSWGNSWSGHYGYAGERQLQFPAFYPGGLHGIRDDPAGGVFHYLSGNANELVRSRAGSTVFKLLGGSPDDDFRNRHNNMKLNARARSLPRGGTQFSGMRLAVCPN